MCGDFNINFLEKNSDLLIDFLKINYNLNMNTQRITFTTKYQTTIDAIIKRNLKKLKSEVYVSYFNDHKPIVSFTYE